MSNDSMQAQINHLSAQVSLLTYRVDELTKYNKSYQRYFESNVDKTAVNQAVPRTDRNNSIEIMESRRRMKKPDDKERLAILGIANVVALVLLIGLVLTRLL